MSERVYEKLEEGWVQVNPTQVYETLKIFSSLGQEQHQ